MADPNPLNPNSESEKSPQINSANPTPSQPIQPQIESPLKTQTAVSPSISAISSEPKGIENVLTATMDRRTFIKWSTVGWAAFIGVIGGYGTMFMRFLFPNVLFEPVQSFRAGFPDEYQVGEVSERWKDKYGVWIVRDEEKIYALSTVCTHLGCTPNWLGNDNKFKCPCHGSGFYKTGINFEGPAPRPLERFKIYLADSGEIMVDKTKKFQQEKGEWKDAESFISV